MTDILDNAEMKMMAAIENLEENLRTLRTGRANAALLDRVEVDYYGSPTPVNQMARISVVEGTQLVVKPYDRTLVKAIVHAVQEAKVAIRNIRREANDAIKKDKELREDEEKSALEDSQKLTDTYIKNIESVVEKKKADILNV